MERPRPVHRIVCATDFSAPASRAAAVAHAWARQLGAELVLLHVDRARGRTAATPDLERLAAELGPGARVGTQLRWGSPAREIVQYAEYGGADMIVLGSHGHAGPSDVVLGSVAERVARTAPCPVVLVPERREARAPGQLAARCLACGMRSEDLFCAPCRGRFRSLGAPPSALVPEHAVAGELTREQIELVLSTEIVGRLGCHAGGRTYVVPLGFAHEAGALYLALGDGLKVRMMRENPAVCFQVDHIVDLANWYSVIVWGTFEELQGPDAAAGFDRVLRRLAAPDTETQPHPSQRGADDRLGHRAYAGSRSGLAARIRITEATGRFEQR